MSFSVLAPSVLLWLCEWWHLVISVTGSALEDNKPASPTVSGLVRWVWIVFGHAYPQ